MARFRGRVTRGHRRLTTWIGPPPQGFLNVASGGATLLASFTPGDPLTIVRNRGMVSVIPQATAADVDIVGAFGIGVVTNEAFAAGIASMPELFSDADWGGWMVWRSFSYSFDFKDSTGIFSPTWNFEVDSKAMRKMKANEVMVEIAESQAGAFGISIPIRTLVKVA